LIIVRLITKHGILLLWIGLVDSSKVLGDSVIKKGSSGTATCSFSIVVGTISNVCVDQLGIVGKLKDQLDVVGKVNVQLLFVGKLKDQLLCVGKVNVQLLFVGKLKDHVGVVGRENTHEEVVGRVKDQLAVVFALGIVQFAVGRIVYISLLYVRNIY